MEVHKCLCPDSYDINSGVVICSKCGGIKIDITSTEQSKEQQKSMKEYIDKLKE